jgi:hypothetical protein
MLGIITGIGTLSPLLDVQIVHLLDRSDLFKISNLVYDGREIVRSLNSSLWSRDSVVGIATRYGLESNPGGARISALIQTGSGAIQPPVQWVLGLSRG